MEEVGGIQISKCEDKLLQVVREECIKCPKGEDTASGLETRTIEGC